MMCVKLTLPPRARLRWLLITTRLSAMSLAGTARTLVAVGTASESSMFVTTRAAAPRSVVVVSSDVTGAAAFGVVGAAGSGATAAGAGAGGAATAGAGGAAIGAAGGADAAAACAVPLPLVVPGR